MAGLDLGCTGGGRRNVIADIQPIPMIDLMMVMISFLLITAVWSHMARTDAAANVPTPGDPTTTPVAEKVLHVEIKDDVFILSWRHEKKVTARTEIPRRAEQYDEGPLHVVRYPELAAGLKTAWESGGVHRDALDHALDRAVLHTPDALPYADVIAVLDALHGVKRPAPPSAGLAPARTKGAFEVTFAID